MERTLQAEVTSSQVHKEFGQLNQAPSDGGNGSLSNEYINYLNGNSQERYQHEGNSYGDSQTDQLQYQNQYQNQLQDPYLGQYRDQGQNLGQNQSQSGGGENIFAPVPSNGINSPIGDSGSQSQNQDAFITPNPNLPPYYDSGLPPTMTPVPANPTVSGEQVIPTLPVNTQPNIDNETPYPDATTTAKIDSQNQSSIVEIYGPAKGQKGTEYLGTGFYVDSTGDLATALHVIKNDTSITVVDSSGKQYQAKVVSERPTADLAILSIGPNHTTKPVTLAPNSEGLKSGNNDYVIGHPNGWQKQYLSPGTFQKPVISSDAQVTGLPNNNPQQTLLESQQNIQPGDSGAPMFNSQGQVVGIVDRGNGGTTGDSVSVNDLWPMLSTSMKADQKTKPELPGPLPSSLHFSGSTALDGIYSAGALGAILNDGSIPLLNGAARVGGVYLGLKDLPSDLDYLKTAFTKGSASEKVDSAIDVGSDLLLTGGGVLGYIAPAADVGKGMQFAGSLMRLSNNLGAFRSYS